MTTATLTTPRMADPPTVNPARPAIGVHGGPRALLRLEGALGLAIGVAAYGALGGSWGWFAALFLVPDARRTSGG